MGRISNNSICFISHGGGPLPLLNDKSHKEMAETLRSIALKIGTPSAIIVISAHWEENLPSITSGSNPELIYDYYGFPEESYHIKYPAPGNPELADEIYNLFKKNKIDAVKNETRGFDHGLFVPLKIMFPNANIPCVQLSLIKNLDPLQHIKIGQALSNLSPRNLLILGSGFSFHNLRLFFTPSSPETLKNNEYFENWLVDTCTDNNITEMDRIDKLINWEKAPAARFCHPREEHLLPLHVCCGAAGTSAKEVFRFEVMGKKSCAFLW